MATAARLVSSTPEGAFRLYFPYDPSLVAGIRAIPKRNFVKVSRKDAYWEVGATAENVAPLANFIKEHAFTVDEVAAAKLRELWDQGPVTLGKETIQGIVENDKLIGFKFVPRGFDPKVTAIIKTAYEARWDPEEKAWRIPFSRTAVEAVQDLVAEHSILLAAGIRDLADAQLESLEKSIKLSTAGELEVDLDIPVPAGLAYRGFQKVGIAFAAEKGNAIIGDDMGIGKTIQCIGLSNFTPSIRSVLIVVPGSLKLNWQREWKKWDVKGLKVGVVANGRPESWPDAADVVIISYSLVGKHLAKVHAKEWDLCALDEAHQLRNPKTKTSQYCLGREPKRGSDEEPMPRIPAKQMVALTGTPILNRPVDLWPLIHAICPERFNNFFAFAKRYCDAVRGSHGWSFDGASNLAELQRELRASCMIRRMKKDVLKELPDKIRQIIPLVNDQLVAAEQRALSKTKDQIAALEAKKTLAYLLDDPAGYDEAADELENLKRFAFRELARLRHETALGKVPQMVEIIREALENGGKIILFAHHSDVIDAYREAFDDIAVGVDGRTPMAQRQGQVDKFQEDTSCRLFVGSIRAAGVGYTLTESAHVIVCEQDWVPALLSQAEDRAHRIGQEQTVMIWHPVVEGSVECRMVEVVVEKQKYIDAAMNTQTDAPAAVDWSEEEPEGSESDEELTLELPTFLTISKDEVAAWMDARRNPAPGGPREGRDERIASRATERAASRGFMAEAEALLPAQIEAVHAGLRFLAARCDGAKEKDEVGYCASDSAVGRALASMGEINGLQAAYARAMLRKYEGQMGTDMLAAMWAEPEVVEELAPAA